MVSKLSEQAENKKAELSAFQEKYKIRIKVHACLLSENDTLIAYIMCIEHTFFSAQGQGEPQQAKEKEGGGSQGVLVSKT